MRIRPIRTSIFKKKEDLSTFIRTHIPKIKEGSVLVVTSKIVALSEGRTRKRKDLTSKEKIIKEESDFVIPTTHVWLTLRNGILAGSAGIDESNSEDGEFILLPKDSYATAKKLRAALMSFYTLSSLGVVISDSRSTPLRAGAVGVALGYAGIKGLKDYRGKKDLFGREFKHERVNVADSLATAAMLSMGEGDEKRPLALIENAPIEFIDTADKNELLIAPHEDLYLPFLSKFPKQLLPKKK